MVEVSKISTKEFGKLYSDYVSNCMKGCQTHNPFAELCLVKDDKVVDIFGNVIGKVVE